jgi:hypothetical protein
MGSDVVREASAAAPHADVRAAAAAPSTRQHRRARERSAACLGVRRDRPADRPQRPRMRTLRRRPSLSYRSTWRVCRASSSVVLVASAWGAVSGLLPVRFPRPTQPGEGTSARRPSRPWTCAAPTDRLDYPRSEPSIGERRLPSSMLITFEGVGDEPAAPPQREPPLVEIILCIFACGASNCSHDTGAVRGCCGARGRRLTRGSPRFGVPRPTPSRERGPGRRSVRRSRGPPPASARRLTVRESPVPSPAARSALHAGRGGGDDVGPTLPARHRPAFGGPRRGGCDVDGVAVDHPGHRAGQPCSWASMTGCGVDWPTPRRAPPRGGVRAPRQFPIIAGVVGGVASRMGDSFPAAGTV